MEPFIHNPHSGRGRFEIRSAIAAILVCVCVYPGTTDAQTYRPKTAEEKIIIESGGASRVNGKVRATSPGTLMEIFVKPGDPVKKGQILGNTELAATKYQLDLALFAVKHNANVNALEGQADAWKATREEAEEAVRKRRADKSRLEWATGMEKFYRGNYEVQLEQLEAEKIHYEYWQAQYENRFFRAPMDGIVSEVRLEIGKPVTFGTHVFTIENKDSYLIPVSVPAELASGVVADGNLPIRTTSDGYVSRGTVDSIAEDPTSPGYKLIKLMIHDRDFPSKIGSNLMGAKFDVLLPQTGEKAPADKERSHSAG